jgi:hypothetical protein
MFTIKPLSVLYVIKVTPWQSCAGKIINGSTKKSGYRMLNITNRAGKALNTLYLSPKMPRSLLVKHPLVKYPLVKSCSLLP